MLVIVLLQTWLALWSAALAGMGCVAPYCNCQLLPRLGAAPAGKLEVRSSSHGNPNASTPGLRMRHRYMDRSSAGPSYRSARNKPWTECTLPSWLCSFLELACNSWDKLSGGSHN